MWNSGFELVGFWGLRFWLSGLSLTLLVLSLD